MLKKFKEIKALQVVNDIQRSSNRTNRNSSGLSTIEKTKCNELKSRNANLEPSFSHVTIPYQKIENDEKEVENKLEGCIQNHRLVYHNA